MRDKHKSGAQHEPISPSKECNELKVRGSVQVFESDAAIARHQDDRSEDRAYKNATKVHEKAILSWTIVAAIVSALYFTATLLIFWQSKRSADAALTAANSAKKQVLDFEVVEQARLTFEDFKATILPGENFVAEVSLTLSNDGATVADDINVSQQWGIYNLRYNPSPEPAKGTLKPTPSETGFSLGPGKKRLLHFRVGEFSFPFGTKDVPSVSIPGLGQINPEEMMRPKYTDVIQGNIQFLITPNVSYQDIFGTGHVTGDCYTYVPFLKDWGACPNLKQHN